MPPPLQNLSVRDVLGIEPDADGVFMILHRDELGIALRGEGVKRGDEVQFILAGGKEGIDDLHGDLDFDLGLPGILLVEDMNDQVVALFGDANVAIIALYGDKLAVLGEKRLLWSDIPGCLLTGGGPVLGDRYESAGKKVS